MPESVCVRVYVREKERERKHKRNISCAEFYGCRGETTDCWLHQVLMALRCFSKTILISWQKRGQGSRTF